MDNPRPSIARCLWDGLASLQVTVVALALLMALVVLCTLAQTTMGIHGAVQAYMRSFIVWWHPAAFPFRLPVFPGGVTVGLMLALNLTTALIKRFDFSWGKSGLWIAHAGLILLVMGEFSTGAFQVETNLSVEEGQTVNYSESPRDIELAITNSTDPAQDLVYSVPAALLARSATVQVPGTPLTLHVKRFFQNATLSMRELTDPPSLATAGVGPSVKVVEEPPVVSDNEMNRTSAFLEPVAKGQSFGTWLVSMTLAAPQSFVLDGQTYNLSMRPRRYFLPYSITLKEFRHDVYAGTDIPKNFSSLVHISNPAKREERDVLIYMNQPLRYEGLTFYQASYGKEGKLSILQVVQNPGWTIPYISCGLVTLGLLLHFGLALRRSVKLRRAE